MPCMLCGLHRPQTIPRDNTTISHRFFKHAVNSPPVIPADGEEAIAPTGNQSSYINYPEGGSISIDDNNGSSVNYTFTFDDIGVFEYNCWEHANTMKGNITVVGTWCRQMTL